MMARKLKKLRAKMSKQAQKKAVEKTERISTPNEQTCKELAETDKGVGFIKCTDRDELFIQLEI